MAENVVDDLGKRVVKKVNEPPVSVDPFRNILAVAVYGLAQMLQRPISFCKQLSFIIEHNYKRSMSSNVYQIFVQNCIGLIQRGRKIR